MKGSDRMTIPQMEQTVETFYSDILRYMVSRIREYATAEDLTQETFFRFIRYAGELNFPSEKKCKAYLFQTAANVCRDYFSGREETVELEETIAAPENDHDLALTLETAITRLPDAQRETAVLYYYHGFRVREIAGIQKITVSAVKSRLKQARDTLRIYLEKEGIL